MRTIILAIACLTCGSAKAQTLLGIDVQGGQSQRSFVRTVDVLFTNNTGLTGLVSGGRMTLTRYDLNGLNPVSAALPVPTVVGSTINIDFGVQGIGGNRATNTGDGYYELGLDLDGDLVIETYLHFFRLFGDVTGNGICEGSDKIQVLTFVGSSNPEADANGDAVVNVADTVATSRAVGRRIKLGLTWDD